MVCNEWVPAGGNYKKKWGGYIGVSPLPCTNLVTGTARDVIHITGIYNIENNRNNRKDKIRKKSNYAINENKFVRESMRAHTQ